MRNRLQNSPPDSSSDHLKRARSEIIVQSLKKISQLLQCYEPSLEIGLFEGGCEISSLELGEGAFAPFEEEGAEDMLCEQLESFEKLVSKG